jgi:hypothetical protein
MGRLIRKSNQNIGSPFRKTNVSVWRPLRFLVQKLVSYFLFEDTVDNKTTARLESIGTMQTNKLEMIATPILYIAILIFSSGLTTSTYEKQYCA